MSGNVTNGFDKILSTFKLSWYEEGSTYVKGSLEWIVILSTFYWLAAGLKNFDIP